MAWQFSRRKALKFAAIGAGSLLLPIEFSQRSALGQSSSGKWISSPIKPFQRDLPIPRVQNKVRSDNNPGSYGGTINYAGTDYYQIEMRKAQVEILPGRSTEVWTYDGISPGPTLSQERGRRAVVRFINNLGNDRKGPIPNSVHLHGMASLPAYDGWANDMLLPGQYKDYIFPNNRAASLWYHDHAVHRTAINDYMGLAGMYVVRDDEERRLVGFMSGEFDVPLLLADKLLNPDGSLLFDDNGHKGLHGDILLVNGVPWPRMAVKRRKYRFRILNTGITRAYRLSLSNGAPLTVIGSDAGLLGAPVQTQDLVIGVAERYDIVIDFAAYSAGTQIVLRNGELKNHEMYAQTDRVMRFDVVGDPVSDNPPLPSTLRPVQPINLTNARRREFVFERSGGLWRINGRIWNAREGEIIANPGLGDTEIWRLTNPGGGWNHPIHVHLVDFQLLKRENGPIRPYERGWKDVFYLGENQTIDVVAQYGPHEGRYMMHCHNLSHEDHDMMVAFQVGRELPGSSPISVPAKPYNPSNPPPL